LIGNKQMKDLIALIGVSIIGVVYIVVMLKMKKRVDSSDEI